MGAKDNFDDQIEGQMSIEDLYRPPERLFAVSRVFARARKEMSLTEQKTFVYALSQFRFTEPAASDVVLLDKKTLAGIIGMDARDPNLSVHLYRAVKDLWKHSGVEIADADIGLYSSGNIITAVTRYKNSIRVRFNPEYIGFFTGLSEGYITMWSADVFQMKSKRSVQFYEYLRQETDTRIEVNYEGISVKTLKEMFDIPKDGEGSYMRKDGHFDRQAFEKRVIQPLCDDLKNCRMINLVAQPDGKLYEKVKRGNKVLGYRFYWTFSASPGIATAEEVHEIQSAVDADPKVLKVARDIVDGKKKPKKNSFSNFEQRDYDFDNLEAQLLRMQNNLK